MFTDKLVAKIPSTHGGIVKEIKFAVDDVCLVGHSLLSIQTDDGGEAVVEIPSQQEEAPQSSPAQQVVQAVNPSSGAEVSGPGKYLLN